MRLKRIIIGLIIIVTVLAGALLAPADQSTIQAQERQLSSNQLTVAELMNYAEILGPYGVRGVMGTIYEKPEEEGSEETEARNKELNPDAPLVSHYNSEDTTTATPLGPRIPQTEGINFTGFTLDELGIATGAGLVPPDTMGVIGPTQFVTNTNGWLRVHDKETGATGALNLFDETFWCPSGTPGVDPCFLTVPNGTTITDVGLSDPRVRYDRHTGRWFFIIIDIPFQGSGLASVANRQLVAYTDGPTIDANTVITYHYFVQDQTLENIANYDDGAFLDYPTLGIDANAMYIGGNMFNGQFGFNTTLWVIPMDSLMAHSATADIADITYAFRRLLFAGEGAFTPQPLDNYDPAATTGFFVGVDNYRFGTLDICEVFNPDFTPGVNVPTYDCTLLTVPNTQFGMDVPHPAGGTNLDALDDRLMMAAMRDGHIWTAHTVGVDSTGVSPISTGSVDRNASRWYEVDVTGGHAAASLVQAGTVYDPSATPLHYWIPSVNVSGQGHAVIGFSAANASTLPSTAWAGRLDTTPLGETGPVSIYQPGLAQYPSSSGRWGDYSMTSVDPCDDMTLWTIQEFSDTPTMFTVDWAVQVLELQAPPPADVLSVSPVSIPSGQSSVQVTLTGDLESGGWYDLVTPEATLDACARSLDVTLGNGITVNNINWVDADTIELDLNTTGATAGSVDITVTNPDEQSNNTQCKLSVDRVYDPQCQVYDSLALFNTDFNYISLIDTLQDWPIWPDNYDIFVAGTGITGQWLMGDWDGDGVATPGVYAEGANQGAFFYTNQTGTTPPDEWIGRWIGFEGYPVAGRMDSDYLNDCIGVVETQGTPPNDAYALHFTCDHTSPGAPVIYGQWMGRPLADADGFSGDRQYVMGDWNGDGLESIAVRRGPVIAYTNVSPGQSVDDPFSYATFNLAQYIGAPISDPYGILVAGDWNKDDLDSFGLFYNDGYGSFFYRNDLDWNSGVYILQHVGQPVGPDLFATVWRDQSLAGTVINEEVSNVEWARIESDDPLVQQTGTWRSIDVSEASGGRYLLNSGSEEDSLMLEFEGNSIEIIFVETNQPGRFTVSIDDTAVRTLTIDSSHTVFDVSTIINYLSPGPHTLRIEPIDGVVAIDAFYTRIRR